MKLLHIFSQRLYLRIWLAVVGGVAVLTLAVAWAWQIAAEQNAQNSTTPPTRELELRDADGTPVSLQRHDDYRGAKRCYRADLGSGGRPGDWTAHVVLGDGGSNTATIRVDPRLEDAPLFQQRDVPYVAGRPNYDASIAPEQWAGRLVWAMDVDPQGKVTHVEVEVAEGVGERLRDRAIAAGYLSLFPPDPGRAATPLRWRRSLDFAPR